MNNTIYRIGFFVLLLLNVGLVVFFTSGPKYSKGRKDLKGKIVQKLRLDEVQKKQFKEMVLAHRTQMQEIQQKEQELMMNYFNRLKDPQTQTEDPDLLKEIGKLFEVKTEITYHHFRDLRLICNEDQLKEYDKLVTDMTQRLIGKGRPLPSNRKKME